VIQSTGIYRNAFGGISARTARQNEVTLNFSLGYATRSNTDKCQN